MSLIVLASDKGSPGVTTTAVALAGVWPRRAILAECDPSGGDLVYRTPTDGGAPLNPNIGMLSLATTARHGLSPNQLEQHLQRLQGGLELVTGLATGDQSAGLSGLWPALGRAFAAFPDADVIADCGRVDASGQALDLMASASLVVLVARTSAEQFAHVRDRALSLLQRVGNAGANPTAGGGLGVPIGVVLVVDPKQRARATAQVDELLRNSGLPVRVIGTIADDPDGAHLINGRGRGRLDRTLLIRSTREVALDLYTRFIMPSVGAGAGAAASQQASSGQAAVQAQAVPPPQPVPPQPSQPPRSQPPQPQPPRAPQPVPPAPSAPSVPQPQQQPPQPPHQYSGAGAPNQYGGGPQRPMAPPQQPQQPGPQYGSPPPVQYGGGQPPMPQPQPQPQPAPRTPQQPAPATTYTAPMPPPPGAPTFRQDTPAQATIWPGEQPPPPSAHEGFTSVTLSGEQGPRPNPPTPPYPDERNDSGPGRGGHRSGPPQENQ